MSDVELHGRIVVWPEVWDLIQFIDRVERHWWMVDVTPDDQIVLLFFPIKHSARMILWSISTSYTIWIIMITSQLPLISNIILRYLQTHFLNSQVLRTMMTGFIIISSNILAFFNSLCRVGVHRHFM